MAKSRAQDVMDQLFSAPMEVASRLWRQQTTALLEAQVQRNGSCRDCRGSKRMCPTSGQLAVVASVAHSQSLVPWVLLPFLLGIAKVICDLQSSETHAHSL
jgi:hypothetical protein